MDQLHISYSGPKAQNLINTRGDIERTIRIDGQIYPLGGWVLQRLRKKLGIPELHRDRIAANPNYLDYHDSQEAEWNQIEADQQERYLNAKKRQTHYRGQSQKI